MTNEHKRIFEEQVSKELSKMEAKGSWSSSFTKATLEKAIDGLEDWDKLSSQERNNRISADGRGKKLYKLSYKFVVLQLPQKDGALAERILVERAKEGGEKPSLEDCRRILAIEDWFDVLKTEHEACGHGKVKALEKALSSSYARIPRWAVEVCLYYR
jgi:hypothetical protein